jgi:septal ring factor EnvC (AmiA/AmiB activator)
MPERRPVCHFRPNYDHGVKKENAMSMPEFFKRSGMAACLLAGVVCGCLAATTTRAQAPTQDLTSRDQAIQRSQQKAGAAYRNLQQAQYEAKLAEQDVLNAQEAHRAAQRHAEEVKRQFDAANKALEAAKAKEATARKAYDEALGGVDQAFQRPPVK